MKCVQENSPICPLKFFLPVDGTFFGFQLFGSTNATQLSELYCRMWSAHALAPITYNGHPERAFFQKFESFGLGQTNWAEILGCILVISSQTIGTILALWVPCSWESVAGSFSYKKNWFLSLKHITPKSSQNKILAVKNLGNSVHTSVFGVPNHITWK